MICVKSSANEDPAKDFNEWIQHVYKQARKNYFKNIKTPCTKSDSTADEETTS